MAGGEEEVLEAGPWRGTSGPWRPEYLAVAALIGGGADF